MAVGKATIIKNGIKVPYNVMTDNASDSTIEGSGWLQKDGKPHFYDARTNVYYPLSKIQAIMTDNTPERAKELAKIWGYNSPEEFLAAAEPIQAEVEQKQTETANKIATDPNNIPYNNPDIMDPVLPTDYAGQLNLGTPDEERMLMQDAIANYKGGSGTEGIDTASTKAKEIMNREDIYSKQIAESGGGKNVEDYIRAMFESSADPLRREADKRMQQQQADLAARGLGMSTVVNDVNSGTQNELLGLLGDLAHKSTVAGRELNLNALKSAADVYGQSNAQQLGAAQDVAGYSTQKQAQQLQGANAVNQLINQQEARRLTNIQLPIAEHDKRVENYFRYLGIPQQAYAGQNPTQATAANVGTTNLQNANANASAQNKLAGDVGTVLAQSYQKQKPTWQNINSNTPATSFANSVAFNTIPQFKPKQ